MLLSFSLYWESYLAIGHAHLRHHIPYCCESQMHHRFPGASLIPGLSHILEMPAVPCPPPFYILSPLCSLHLFSQLCAPPIHPYLIPSHLPPVPIVFLLLRKIQAPSLVLFLLLGFFGSVNCSVVIHGQR